MLCCRSALGQLQQLSPVSRASLCRPGVKLKGGKCHFNGGSSHQIAHFHSHTSVILLRGNIPLLLLLLLLSLSCSLFLSTLPGTLLVIDRTLPVQDAKHTRLSAPSKRGLKKPKQPLTVGRVPVLSLCCGNDIGPFSIVEQASGN